MEKYEDYQVEGSFKKHKKFFIFILILWLITVIVFVAPLSLALTQISDGVNIIDAFINHFIENVIHPFSTIGGLFKSATALKIFGGGAILTTILYVILFWKGFKKDMPKHEYTNTEYGSSDWSKKGEQYRVLSDKEGIILAEENYLPVDKRGNVNVLVVGRFRFW